MNRREWIGSSLAGLAGLALGQLACGREALGSAQCSGEARLCTRPHAPKSRLAAGEHALDLGTGRDGFLYVPEKALTAPAPLLVFLHGATQASAFARRFIPDCEARGIVLLAPDSRGPTWDVIVRGDFGEDVAFIDRALGKTFDSCDIDAKHLALAGFSDGASYALCTGLPNGDLFTNVLAFSPGFLVGSSRNGRPRIFVSHGTADQILNIDRTSRVIVPELRRRGYDPTYVEFDGPHTVPATILEQALGWFLS